MSSVAHLMKYMEQDGIKATHFLFLSFSYKDCSVPSELLQRGVNKKFAEYLFWQEFSYGVGYNEEPLKLRWKSFPRDIFDSSSAVFWTVSRYADVYVEQMTKSLLEFAKAGFLKKEGLEEVNIQIDSIVLKNLNYKVNIEIKAEKEEEPVEKDQQEQK